MSFNTVDLSPLHITSARRSILRLRLLLRLQVISALDKVLKGGHLKCNKLANLEALLLLQQAAQAELVNRFVVFFRRGHLDFAVVNVVNSRLLLILAKVYRVCVVRQVVRSQLLDDAALVNSWRNILFEDK